MKKLYRLISHIIIMIFILQSVLPVYAEELTVYGDSLPSYYMTQKLPPLRNQGSYETCWAHTDIALAEIYALNHPEDFAKGDLSNLSEAQLAYFMYNTAPDPTGGTAGDTNGFISKTVNAFTFGGSILYSENVINTWVSAISENLVPYSNISTYVSKGISSDMAYNRDIIHMTGYRNWSMKDDRAALKQEIINNGAFATRIYANTSYFNSAKNAFYCPTVKGLNHAVTIVGWDDNFSKENFKTKPENDGAWIVRNSWVATNSLYYGYNGYFYLSYYDKNLDYGYAHDFESIDAHDTCYQYDGGMITGAFICPGIKGANIFNVTESEYGDVLDTVGFYSDGYNTPYQIDVYVSLSENSIPEQGLHIKTATVTGQTTAPGYYSAKLNTPVYLSPGSRFCTVVTLAKKDTAGIGFEISAPSDYKSYASTVSKRAGESYYKKPGYKWRDVYTVPNMTDYGNVRIKAYTRRALEEDICDYAPKDTVSDPSVNPSVNPSAGNNDNTDEKEEDEKEEDDNEPLIDNDNSSNDNNKPNDDNRPNDDNKPTDDNTPNDNNTSGDDRQPEDNNESNDNDQPGDSGDESEVIVPITVIEPPQTVPKGMYSITYDIGADINEVNNLPVSCIYMPGSVKKLPKLSRTGYTFKGWYDAATNKKCTRITKKQAGNIKLIARWSENRYAVKLYKGIKGTTKGVQGKQLIFKDILYTQKFSLPQDIFAKEGYVFKGWSKNKKLKVISYAPEDILFSLSGKNKAVVKLYAVWEPK